jgi:dTDP-4-dehydrorhamnose 3,5-epimerase
MLEFEKTFIDDLLIAKPSLYNDNRGFFFEAYSKRSWMQEDLNFNFVQDNVSFSENTGTLRGLHFQRAPFEQTKFVQCLKGAIFDVAVDLRKDSPTFKKWFSVELNEENHWGLLIPKGFAHGFQTLKDNTIVQYKVDNFYEPQFDTAIIWNDPSFNILWPIPSPILSEKDSRASKYL